MIQQWKMTEQFQFMRNIKLTANYNTYNRNNLIFKLTAKMVDNFIYRSHCLYKTLYINSTQRTISILSKLCLVKLNSTSVP